MFRKQKQKIDAKFLTLSLALTALGLVAVADASAPQAIQVFNDRFYFLKGQGVWALLGIATLLVVAKIPYGFWQKLATPLFFGSLVFLILVLFPGFGSKLLGARRWLVLGPLRFQPSELIKFTSALYFAKLASKNKPFMAYLLPFAATLFLVMLQPDLGTSLVIASIGVVQIFMAEVNIYYFIVLIFGGGLASGLLILFSDYRRARLVTFFEQTQDPLGQSYHIRQILLSLGLGGLWGVGLGASRQKYLFLPEAATDSIFAVIAEEVGFIGATVLIITLAFFVYKAFRISSNAPDKFSKILGFGLSAWLGFQIFLNIASNVALVPLTGVPLPFFSYGGSSLTMVLIAVGILLNISKYGAKEKEFKNHRR